MVSTFDLFYYVLHNNTFAATLKQYNKSYMHYIQYNRANHTCKLTLLAVREKIFVVKISIKVTTFVAVLDGKEI